MRKKLLRAVLLVFMLLTLTSVPGAEEKKVGAMTVDEIKKALGMSIYLQGGYTYNLKNPDSQENELRVFDHKSNSFGLDLAQLVFAKDAPMDGVGFKLKLSAGETAKWIHARGLSGAPLSQPQTGQDTDVFDLTEAYIEYLAPLGKGLKFDFGKMVTYHGAEVIEAKDNPNYSRSFLFNYAIPFTHTGLKAGYAFSDAVNANIHIVNGWDNADDNNKSKTFGLSVGLMPIEQLALNFNLMYGPEKDSNTHDNRSLFDWVGTIKPVKNLAFILNYAYAKEKNKGAEDSKWDGLSGIVKYDFTDKYSLSLRSEYFNDKQGARTGTIQKLKEVTLTPEIRLAGGLILRPEYRHDWSGKDVFDSGSRKKQDTIALGVMYTW